MLILDACPSLLTLTPDSQTSGKLFAPRALYREQGVSSASTDTIDERLDVVAQQSFRARFHLRGRERALVHLRGLRAIRSHAHDVIKQRLAPATPHNDGRQTPYRGHPVFMAQHATGTCCRSCLERNHQIARGHELTDTERDYVVDAIMRWIGREIPDAPQ